MLRTGSSTSSKPLDLMILTSTTLPAASKVALSVGLLGQAMTRVSLVKTGRLSLRVTISIPSPATVCPKRILIGSTFELGSDSLSLTSAGMADGSPVVPRMVLGASPLLPTVGLGAGAECW